MAKKEFSYRGKSLEELQNMSDSDFLKLLPSRQRRTIKRGYTELQKRLIKKLSKKGDNVKTHVRDIIVMPDMVGKRFNVYNGKEFSQVIIMPEMIGHYLGEFSQTRKRISHSSPGVGATKSSSAISVR